MTSIARVLAVPGVGAGYCDDLAALQSRYLPPAERFAAVPVTPGFRSVREVAETVSLALVSDDGKVAWGDCVAVAYGGRAGRDPVFRSAAGVATIEKIVAPLLIGRTLTSFRELAVEVDALVEQAEMTQPGSRVPKSPRGRGVSRRALLTAPARILQAAREDEGETAERVTCQRALHTAVRYGASQALLQAVALAQGVTMAEVIAQEWNLPSPSAPIPIHAQSGAERYLNAEKMIVRGVASLPHGLVEDVPSQLGSDGSEMTRYIRWLKERIEHLGGEEYWPTIHLDLHGALGQIFGNQLGKMLGQLRAWELAANPYPLRIESPVILDSRDAQIAEMKKLRDYVRQRQMRVQLAADEWANTLDDIRAFVDAQAADMIQIKMPVLGSIHNSAEAVLACRAGGTAAFLGGSCAETELSARVSVHVALATRPHLMMAKPGMGVDEAVSLVRNEMARTLALVRPG